MTFYATVISQLEKDWLISEKVTNSYIITIMRKETSYNFTKIYGKVVCKVKKQTILEWCRNNHIYIDAPCDGKGVCGRCKVKLLSHTQEISEKEDRCLTKTELSEGIRLACVTEITEQTAFELIGADWQLGFDKEEAELQKKTKIKYKLEEGIV